MDNQCTLCQAALNEGRTKDAIDGYHTLLRSNPNHKGALVGLGIIRAKQKRYSEAEGLFKKTLILDSDDIDARKHLAALYREIGQLAKAVHLEDGGTIGRQDTPLQKKEVAIGDDHENLNVVRKKPEKTEDLQNANEENGTSPGPTGGETDGGAREKEISPALNHIGLITHAVREKNDFQQWVQDNFSTDNSLGLILRRGEQIREYMNQEYYWKQIHAPKGASQLFYRLQSNFHELINGYFNTGKLAQIQTRQIKTLIDQIHKQTDDSVKISFESPEAFVSETYRLLKRGLVVSDNHCCVRFKTMDHLAAWKNKDPEVIALYRVLQERLSRLYADGAISTFLVHGSYSTMDYTPFSDVDTQLFLSDATLASPDAIRQIAKVISGANIHLKLFDPLQHHGFFISTDLDKFAYPESFLPINTMAESILVMGDSDQHFSLRSSDFENRYAVWHTGYYFRTSRLRGQFPQNPFEMKRFLSRLAMMPVFYLELFEGSFPYKRDAFKMVQPHVPTKLYTVFDVVTRAREQWVPGRMMRFNRDFYQDVFNFSEWMLDRLKELDDAI